MICLKHCDLVVCSLSIELPMYDSDRLSSPFCWCRTARCPPLLSISFFGGDHRFFSLFAFAVDLTLRRRSQVFFAVSPSCSSSVCRLPIWLYSSEVTSVRSSRLASIRLRAVWLYSSEITSVWYNSPVAASPPQHQTTFSGGSLILNRLDDRLDSTEIVSFYPSPSLVSNRHLTL